VTGKVSEYARQAKIIHLEIDPAEVHKIVRADVAVTGDARKSLKMLTANVSPSRHEEWLREFRDADRVEYGKVVHKDIYPAKPGLTMGEVIRTVSEQTGGEAILVTDVGQQQMVAARYFSFTKSRSFVTSGGLGTMGFGLPASVGAQLAAPERPVVLTVGDGGFQMTIQELGSIAHHKLPVKIILMNNSFLGMVRQWQELFFDKRYSFTELSNPDFLLIAKGYGIEGNRLTSREKLEDSVAAMLNHPGPYLLEVIVEKEDNVFPMVPAGASVSQIMLEPPPLQP